MFGPWCVKVEALAKASFQIQASDNGQGLFQFAKASRQQVVEESAVGDTSVVFTVSIVSALPAGVSTVVVHAFTENARRLGPTDAALESA